MASSNTNPSICIPRVFPNITREQIKNTFKKLKLGFIERIDMVQRENEKGEKFQRVFIHFKFWFQTKYAENVKTKLMNGHDIKIVYDDPWFWKVSMSKVTKPNFQENTQENLGVTHSYGTPKKIQSQRKPTLSIDISSIQKKEVENTVQEKHQEKEQKGQKEKNMIDVMREELLEQKKRIEEMLKTLETKPEPPTYFPCSPPITPLQEEDEERIQTPQAPKATRSFDKENIRETNLQPRKLFS